MGPDDSISTMTTRCPCSDDGDCEEKVRKHSLHDRPRPCPTDPTVKRILVHYGPLTVDHPAYVGSEYNVLVEWDNGRYSTETLEHTIEMDLQKVLKYSIDCELLNDSRWSHHFPPRILRQIPRVINTTPSAALRRDLDHCRAVATAVKKSFKECLGYQADESCRTLREGVCEIFIDAHAMGANCYETIVESNKDLFQRCFNARRKKLRTRQEFPAIRHRLLLPLGANPDRLDDSEGDSKAKARQSIEAIQSFAIRTAQHHLTGTGRAVEAGKRGSCSDLGGSHIEFGNFSLLASRSKIPPQFRHVDAYEYETQYVMALQPSTEATITHVVPDALETPADVVQLWTKLAAAAHAAPELVTSPVARRPGRQSHPRTDSTSVVDRIRRVMEADATIRFWIRHYGKVLCRPHRMIRLDVTTPSNWNAGSVLCVPGGVVHGAPRSGKFRVVLFFTGTPITGSGGGGDDGGSEETYQYRSNDQFTGPTLTATLAYRLWDKVDEPCREFLRVVLRQCIREEPCEDVDFASYLQEEIGSCHEIGEILRGEQEAKRERQNSRDGGGGGGGAGKLLASSPGSRRSSRKRPLNNP